MNFDDKLRSISLGLRQMAKLLIDDESLECAYSVIGADLIVCATRNKLSEHGVDELELPVHHAVTCKKFPDPNDERAPVGPCTCGADPGGEVVHERGTCLCPAYEKQHRHGCPLNRDAVPTCPQRISDDPT